MTKDELRQKANDLPLAPGVYLMMDKTGKVIYVGKAKKLKNRVSQYFQDTASHNEKTQPWCPRWAISTPSSSPRSSRPDPGKLSHQAPYAPVQHPAEGRQGLSLCAAGRRRGLSPLLPGGKDR